MRENAKYLMEIIDSLKLKKPENWNINIEINPNFKKKSLNSLKPNKNFKKDKKFINISNILPLEKQNHFRKDLY